MDYASFFQTATGRTPFPYQERLGTTVWPELLDIPTGLGKTAAVTVAWLWKLHQGAPDGTRRLVYCLPMRVLVEQTCAEVDRFLTNLAPHFVRCPLPAVHVLMGGDADKVWDERPDHPAILVGTQDMLLSRALNRGYGVSRYRWPMQFAQLHSDALWVLDETQLMGVAVETSAQLQGLREKLGTHLPVHTLWMSATLSNVQLDTIDHAVPDGGWTKLSLDASDEEQRAVLERTQSRKALLQAPVVLDKATARGDYIKHLAELVLARHIPDTLTLVVLNRVTRAQDLYAALLKRGRVRQSTALIHSRFRPPDRAQHETLLHVGGDRIIVATQAIEAGVDVSAATLITELAPWSSLVQRFGRCNRYGEVEGARVFWLDVALEKDSTTPYEPEDLLLARTALIELDDVGPQRVRSVNVPAREVVRPVLRRKDLLDLFDTTPDLSGNDLDVASFIRDGDDTDVQIFWRTFEGEPGPDVPAPDRAELCAVSVTAARSFAQKEDLWRWDPLVGCWVAVDRFHIRPGQVLLAEARAGGYGGDLGWLPRSKTAVTPLPSPQPPIEQMDGDPDTCTGNWVTLAEHLDDTAREARAIAEALSISAELSDVIVTAANWHDVGKAHSAFQNALRDPRDGQLWAKSERPTFRVGYRMDDGTPRPGFRHELASALAWSQSQADHPHCGLIAYLIAAHHGKVRLSIRSMPNERHPDGERLFARGVWDGDTLPSVAGFLDEPLSLHLDPMRLGANSWLSTALRLRDDPAMGPFRLAFLEALVRVADWRASRLAQMREPAHA